MEWEGIDFTACAAGQWGLCRNGSKAVMFYKLEACEVPRRELYFLTLCPTPPPILFCRVSSLRLQIT